MKINKKIVGLSVTGAIVVAAIPTLAVTLTACSSNTKVTNFYEAFNDPYKELDMYAQNLDHAGLKLYQKPSAVNKNKDGTTKLTQVSGFDNFKEAAEEINNSMRKYVTDLANTDAIKSQVEKNATVLFVRGSSITGDPDKLLDELNQFHMEQPMLYSQIYSNTSIEENPGFGYKFPMPVDKKSNGLFDDWFEIGASQMSNNQSAKTTIPLRLANSWKGTADFVFYLYDSSKLTKPEYKTEVEKTINGFTNKDGNEFLPARLLKKDGITNHVIPLDVQLMYNGIWDQVGSFAMDYFFAKIFNNINPETKNVTNFNYIDKKGAKTKSNDEVDKILNDANWNPYKIDNSKFGIVRPETTSENKKDKFAVASYNVIAHTFSLGIQPDFISEFKGNLPDSNPLKYFMYYLTPFKNKLDKDDNRFFWENKNNFANFLVSNNVYAMGDNREKFADLAQWPIDDNSNSQNNLITLAASDGVASPTSPDAIEKAKVIPIFTEQNESPNSQTQFPKNFELMVNTKNGTTMTVSNWKKEQE